MRERVVAGKLNKVIAAELGISARTVEVHRAHLVEKMGADSLAALSLGYVTPLITYVIILIGTGATPDS